MAKMTNLQLWNYLRDTNPNFKNITSKGTADTFTEKGYEALTRTNIDALNDFFKLSMRVSFQRIDVARAKNPLERIGLVFRYDTPNGGFVQRMAISSVKPTTPLYKGLNDGDSVDMFKVRKPKVEERFFQQNYDYQSYITLQDFQIKTLFISEYGVSDFVSGIMQSMANGYIKQSYANIMEVLNAGINSATYPLQDSQQLELSSWTAEPTAAELKELILDMKDVATMMETSPSIKGFNAAGFETAYDPGDFVVLARAGIKDRIALNVELGAFNPEKLSVPFDWQEVQHFGIAGYVLASDETTPAYPMYSSINGEVIGYSETEGKTGTTADLDEDEVVAVDANPNVIAIIAQKGLIFENIQNPYTVLPTPYNPAGLYLDFWASSANNSICFDYYYGCIVISKPAS